MKKSKADFLSHKQSEVLNQLAHGHTYQQIADRMGVSIDTIRTHVRRLYQKLEVRKSTQAIAKHGAAAS